MSYETILKYSKVHKVELVVVSKRRSNEAIKNIYDKGQKIFGENRVQELVQKQKELPGDIKWHMIGKLQTNKVKYIASFISLIQSVDSIKLAREIEKQAKKNDRILKILIQVKIAKEETKSGVDISGLEELVRVCLKSENIDLKGFMGIGSLTQDEKESEKEFAFLAKIFKKYHKMHPENIKILSMGMSGDYKLGVENGANMIRVGSLVFG